MGPLALQKYYFSIRKDLSVAMDNAIDVINQVSDEFYKLTGRKYELYEKYKLDDAQIGVIALNSTAGTIKDAIDKLRDKGIKIGLLKPRCFRPLPYTSIPQELKNLILSIFPVFDIFIKLFAISSISSIFTSAPPSPYM